MHIHTQIKRRKKRKEKRKKNETESKKIKQTRRTMFRLDETHIKVVSTLKPEKYQKIPENTRKFQDIPENYVHTNLAKNITYDTLQTCNNTFLLTSETTLCNFPNI